VACTCCSVLSVRWRVVAGPSDVHRRCRRCDRLQPFRSSGRFRVNASGRRLDVWLIYRCTTCETTWNRPVHERVAPTALGVDLERYHANDPDLARAVALRSSATAAAIDGHTDGPLQATLVVDQPVAVRLDRLLAAHLDVPRAAVAGLVDDPRLLRRPPRAGTVISLDGCRWRR
jgi:hypothetical protein